MTSDIEWDVMSRRNAADQQYFYILEDLLAHGDVKGDRTGTGTKALFGQRMEFDLSDGYFPILTTKRVYWKSAIKELLWFLSGSTDIRDLLKQGVHIWSEWPHERYVNETGDKISLKEFENRLLSDDNFGDRWADIHPCYGSVWRKIEGPDGKIYDQISDTVDLIKNNPNSRRILFSGWNVPDIKKMILPPCHTLYQYQVTSDGKLNSLLFARSQDFFIGTCFNLVGAAALQLMFAHVTGLVPGTFTWLGGDVHLYSNHEEQAREQLSRIWKEAPKMKIINKRDSIFDFTIDDFELTGYDPHPPIIAPIAV